MVRGSHHLQERGTVIYEGLIFALGFLVAGLLTLLILPAVWRRAVRLSARRLEMQMPLSMTEIVAERDQLRAEFAVKQRQLEQNLESLVNALAEAKAELGRRTILIAKLEQDHGAAHAEIGALTTELSNTHRTNNETRAELAAHSTALYDASGLLDDRQQKILELERVNRDLNQAADQRRGSIAALQTQVATLELRIESLGRELTEAGSKSERKDRDLLAIAEERDISKAELGVSQIRADNLQGRIGFYVAQLAVVEEELSHLRESDALAKRHHGEQRAAIAGYQSTLDGNARLTDEVQARLEQARLHALEIERRFTQRLDALRQEKAAVDGALEAARNERDKLKQELAARRTEERAAPAQEADFAKLRTAISDMAADLLDVVQIAGNRESQQQQDAQRLISPKRPTEQATPEKTFAEQRALPEKKRATQSSITNVRN
jgi:chromosome segregation ATPase